MVSAQQNRGASDIAFTPTPTPTPTPTSWYMLHQLLLDEKKEGIQQTEAQ